MPISDAAPMRAAMGMLDIPVEQLWIDYIGLGGELSLRAIIEFIDGHSALQDHDYDVLAQALNELFMDQEEDHPFPYTEEVDPPPDA
jgi:hypothetical protein